MTSPAFILLNPQMGENIGAVARAMSNFGLTDLRIVAPRDGWPNPAAIAMAAHGTDVIENATVVDSLKDALKDVHTIYATTPREDVLNKTVFTPRQAMHKIASESVDERAVSPRSGASCESQQTFTEANKKVAILFGAERAGLSNEDIVLADAIISIPVNAENPSLNLAQAAVVIAYEWFSQRESLSESVDERAISQRSGASCGFQQKIMEANTMATKAELEGMFEHAKLCLDRINYFREANKTRLMWQHLRSIWVKSNLTSQEVRTLRGVLRAIMHKLP